MRFTIKLEIIDRPDVENTFVALLDNSGYYAEFITDLRDAVEEVVVDFLQGAIDRDDIDVDIF